VVEEAVDGAPETRRDNAGEGGAGRLENRSEAPDMGRLRLLIVLNAGLTGLLALARLSGMTISVPVESGVGDGGCSGGSAVVDTVGVVEEEAGRGDRGGSRCCVFDGVGVVGENRDGDKGTTVVEPFIEDR